MSNYDKYLKYKKKYFKLKAKLIKRGGNGDDIEPKDEPKKSWLDINEEEPIEVKKEEPKDKPMKNWVEMSNEAECIEKFISDDIKKSKKTGDEYMEYFEDNYDTIIKNINCKITESTKENILLYASQYIREKYGAPTESKKGKKLAFGEKKELKEKPRVEAKKEKQLITFENLSKDNINKVAGDDLIKLSKVNIHGSFALFDINNILSKYKLKITDLPTFKSIMQSIKKEQPTVEVKKEEPKVIQTEEPKPEVKKEESKEKSATSGKFDFTNVGDGEEEIPDIIMGEMTEEDKKKIQEEKQQKEKELQQKLSNQEIKRVKTINELAEALGKAKNEKDKIIMRNIMGKLNIQPLKVILEPKLK